MDSNLREISKGLKCIQSVMISEQLTLLEVLKDPSPVLEKASFVRKRPEPEFEDVALVDH